MCNDVHHNRETGKEKILLTDEISLLNLATETSLVWLFAEAQITVRPQNPARAPPSAKQLQLQPD